VNDEFDWLFDGKGPMFEALRKGGKRRAAALRNVPWVNWADDGDIIINVWRSSLLSRGSTIYSDFARKKRNIRNPARRAKREALMSALKHAKGKSVRVVLLDERKAGSGLTSGCKFDSVRWVVRDVGDRYNLIRGRRSAISAPEAPLLPKGFGAMSPRKRKVMSEHIERLAAVKRGTLRRAGHRCEIPDCDDQHDYQSLDVHHITRLGDKGADHTDNTVALCPAHHTRVHRGVFSVRQHMEQIVERLARRRTRSSRQLVTRSSSRGPLRRARLAK